MNTLVLDCDIWRYLSACSLWGTRPRGQKTLFRNCSRTIVRKEGVGEMEVWKSLQMGSPASILLSRRKESMGFLRNKCFASLFVLHISLICITGGLDGTASLGKRRHHRKPEQRLRRGEQLPPDASVFLSENNTVVQAHKGSTTSLLCQVHKDSQHGVITWARLADGSRPYTVRSWYGNS